MPDTTLTNLSTVYITPYEFLHILLGTNCEQVTRVDCTRFCTPHAS